MSRSVELHEALPVRLENARRYLSAVGWQKLKQKDGISTDVHYEAYRSGSQSKGKAQIILPLSADAVDLQWRIRDAIQTLVDAEDRSPMEVVQSIQRIGYDVVRSAVPSEQVRDDTIKLTAATEFVSNMRGLLAAAATTENRPLPYFGRLLKKSVQFADACRFGHTFRGSFGFVVESPLPEPEPTPLLPDEPPVPFERRVIQRLAHGIANVVEASAAQSTRPITSAVGTGLSANGCDQLADLIDNVNPAGLGFSFDLSPAWGFAREMHSATFSVNGGHAEICRSAARELRRDDTDIPANVSGRIVRLQNQTDPTDLNSRTGEHEVLVVWASRDFGDIQVRINLSPANYLEAVRAHGAGQPILVSGFLRRHGRQWVLAQPHSFLVPAQGELPLVDEEE